MSENKDNLINLLSQMQYIIDEDYEDNEDIQNAFNALACAIDYYVEESNI
jgi:hypothetical protein